MTQELKEGKAAEPEAHGKAVCIFQSIFMKVSDELCLEFGIQASIPTSDKLQSENSKTGVVEDSPL